MKLEEFEPGVTVYHRLYVSWGKGTVIRLSKADGLESLFERGGRYRVVVQFEAHDTPTRCFPRVLRATPNRKKIREMVEFYASRGTMAVDGGDRLIFTKVE